MKTILTISILILILSVFSCKGTDNQKQDELEEKELELRQKELELQEREDELNNLDSDNSDNTYNNTTSFEPEPVAVTKFMYVLIETSEPEIKTRTVAADRPIVSSGYFDEPMTLPTRESYVVPEYYSYKSDVIEVYNYTEDKRYKEIDRFERTINSKIEWANTNLQLNISLSDDPVYASAKILSRKSFVFDTYQEASQHRRNQ